MPCAPCAPFFTYTVGLTARSIEASGGLTKFVGQEAPFKPNGSAGGRAMRARLRQAHLPAAVYRSDTCNSSAPSDPGGAPGLKSVDLEDVHPNDRTLARAGLLDQAGHIAAGAGSGAAWRPPQRWRSHRRPLAQVSVIGPDGGTSIQAFGRKDDCARADARCKQQQSGAGAGDLHRE